MRVQCGLDEEEPYGGHRPWFSVRWRGLYVYGDIPQILLF